MGYPDFQMKEFDGYDCYDEIGISMAVAHSEIGAHYFDKGFPVHMYCAETPEDVAFCVRKGASLITANDPTAAMELLK